MNSKMLHQKILPAVVVFAGLLALQWAWMPKPSEVERRQYTEKINLAMRQAAHRLLALEGDSTGAIPPVEQLTANEFLLRLETNFNYDSLPIYLQAAFSTYGIKENYTVAVKSCEDINSLILGYTQSDFTVRGNVPCGGRERDLACYCLGIIFTERPAGEALAGGWLRMLLAGGILLSLGYAGFVFFSWRKGEPATVQPAVSNENTTTENSELLKFGNSVFDVTNQTIKIGSTQQMLTFREAKLLHVFCKNINQLLERNQLLDEVWGDEGVIVGRSLDVFVSRLRKILKEDETVRITNVHSVGYRLEIV